MLVYRYLTLTLALTLTLTLALALTLTLTPTRSSAIAANPPRSPVPFTPLVQRTHGVSFSLLKDPKACDTIHTSRLAYNP